jgi:hypothetical protein
MAEPTDNQFEYKPLGESYDKPPTKEAIPGVTIPKSTSTLPDSGNAGGLASSSPSTPQYDYKPLTESYDKPPTPSSQSGSTLPSQKSQKTLPPEKPGIFKQAWEGTKEVGRELVKGQQGLSHMLYSIPEAVADAFVPEKHQQTLPDTSRPEIPERKDWGTRQDGSKKGNGWLGVLNRPDGKGVMTEFTVGTNINDKEMEIPTLVPGLSKEQVDYILNSKDGDKNLFRTPMGQSIMDKAIAHAEGRVKEGKSPFSDETSVGEKPEESFMEKFAKNIRGTQEAIEGINKLPELQPTEYSDVSKHPISASLAGGAGILPQLAPFALGPIGQAIGMTAFALSGYKETHDKVYKSQLASGKSPEEAKQNAMIAGGITGAVYAFGGKYLSKGQGIASGLFRKALGKGAFTAEEVFTNAAGSEMAKGFAKSFGVGLGTTMAALAAYGTIPVAVERAFGVTGPEEPTVWEALKSTIPSSVGLTIISSIFGLAARTKPFSDPRPNLKGKDAENYAKQRMAAVNAVALQLKKIDPKMAENFRWNSIAAINEGKPINLSAESLREPTAQPEPTGEPSAPTPPEQTLPLTQDQRALDSQFFHEPLGSPEDELVQGKREEYKNDLEDFGKAVSESPAKPEDIPAMTAQDFKKANDQATADRHAEVMQKLDLAKAGGLESPRPIISLPAIVPGGPAVDLTKMPTEANVLPPTDGSGGAPTDLTMPTPAPTTPTAPEMPQKPSGETLPPSVKPQTPEDIVKQTLQDEMSRPEVPAEQEPTAQPVAEPPVEAPVAPEVPVAPEPSPEPSAPKVSDKEKRVKAVPQGMQIGIEALQDALHQASSGEVATRITNLERRISKKPELETEAVKKLIQEAKDYLKSKGLEIQDVVKEGDAFDYGLTVKAEFQLTDSDIIGSEIISKITTQGLMKDGVLVSTPSIMVDADGRTLTYKQKREEIKAGKILYPDEPFVPEKTAEVPPQKESSKVNIVENNSFRGGRRTSVMGPDDTQIVARNANGEDVSFLHYTKHEDGTISVRKVETLESEERKGYATELVKKAVADHGIIRGWTDTTPKGKAFFTKIAKSHPELMTPELAKSLLEPKKEEPTAQVKKEEVTPPVSEPSAPVEPKAEVAPEAPTPKEEAPSKPMTLDEAEDYARKAGYLVGDERLNPDMLSEVQEAIENDKLGMKPANSDIMGIINNAKVKTEEPAGQPRVETATEPETAQAKEEQTAQEQKEPYQMTREEWMKMPKNPKIGQTVTQEQLATHIHEISKDSPYIDPDAKINKSPKDYADHWMPSDTYTLAEVPIDKIDWFGVAGQETKYREEPPKATGPIVVDANNREVGRHKRMYGVAPETIVLDGQHRLHLARQRGDKTILAWVGNHTAKRFGIEPTFQNAEYKSGFEKNLFVPRPFGQTHKDAVMKAVSEGKVVDPEIMKDYPDLAKEPEPAESKERTAQITDEPVYTPPEGFLDNIVPMRSTKNKDKWVLYDKYTISTHGIERTYESAKQAADKANMSFPKPKENPAEETKALTAQVKEPTQAFDALPQRTKDRFNELLESRDAQGMLDLLNDSEVSAGWRFYALVKEFEHQTGKEIPNMKFKRKSALESWASEKPTGEPKSEPKPKTEEPTAPSKPTTGAFYSLPQASKNLFNEAFESGNSDKMFQILHKGNKILRAEFENRTGIKLPKTVWVPKEELEKWSATVEKPTAKPVDITKAKERIEEIDESIKGLNKQAEALKKKQKRSKYGSKLNDEMSKQLSENYDKVRVLSQEAEPLRKEIRSTYLHEVVEQGDEPNRMAAQEILDNQGVSKKTYDAIRNMVKDEIKSYGKIDDDVSSQTEDSVTSMITTSPKSDDANSLKKLVLNQLINRHQDHITDLLSSHIDKSTETYDALHKKFIEPLNDVGAMKTSPEKVTAMVDLQKNVDVERERLIAEDKKKSKLESEKEKARDAAKEEEKTRKYPPTPSATEKPSDVRVMAKKPQEFTIPETPQKLKEDFEAGKWLYVPDGHRDPFTYESSKPKSEENQKQYDKSWEAVLKGTVKKTKNGIRVESQKVRKQEGGEFAPTTYHDFLPIDTTPKTEELAKQEGLTYLGAPGEKVGREGLIAGEMAQEGRRVIRDIAKADPAFAKNPRFTVALISKDDPKAGSWLVYNVSPEASKESKTKRQYKINPSSISNALHAEIEEGNIKDGAIIEMSPGYLEGKAGEIFAAKKGADTKALFSLENKPNIDRAIKILDDTYEKNIRIASAINKLQDMEKRGIISADGSQQAVEMLNGMSRPVMPKSEVLDILRKGSYNVDTGTAGRSIGTEGTRGEGNASPETQVPSASRKVVAGDVQDQRAKRGRTISTGREGVGGENQGMGEGLPMRVDSGAEQVETGTKGTGGRGQAVRAGDEGGRTGEERVGVGREEKGVGEGLDKTLPVLPDTGQTEKDVSGAIGDPRRVMGQGNKMPDSIRANEGKISQDIADLREKSGNPDIEAAREITPTQTAAAEILSKAFSKRIVWVQANSKFDGVAIDASRIYLASHLSDAQSIMKTFGHELYHTIKNEGRVGSDILKTAGETFERDIRTAIPEKTFVRFTDWRNKENIKIGLKEQTPDELWEEYGGYVLGDAIRDPRFYENLQRQSPSSFRKFVDWIVDAFRKMGFISEKVVASNYYEPDKAERLIKSSSDLIKTYLESRPKEITEPKLEEPLYATEADYPEYRKKMIAEIQAKMDAGIPLTVGEKKDFTRYSNQLAKLKAKTGESKTSDIGEGERFSKPKLEEPKLSLATERQWKSILSRQRDIEGLQPAIKNTDTGDIQSSKFGDTHEDLRRNAPKGQKYISGFIDRNGDFFSRDEAEKKWGIRGSEDIYNALYINNPNERTDFTPEEEKVNAHDARVFYSLFGHEFDPDKRPDIPAKDIVDHAKDALAKTEHLYMPGFEIAKKIGKGVSQFVKTLIAPTTISPEHTKAAREISIRIGERNRREDVAYAQIHGELGKFEDSAKHPYGFFSKIGVGDESKGLNNPGILFESDVSQGRLAQLTNAEINERYGTTGLQANMIRKAEKVTKDALQEALDALERAGVPLETLRQFYFPGMHSKDSVRAFNQAMGEYLEAHPGEPKPLGDWEDEEKTVIKNRVDELLKDKKGSDVDHYQYLTKHNLYGKESYKKHKTFDDVMTAREFGLRSVSPNPMDHVALKLAEMNTAIVGHDYINNTARPNGDVKFLGSGKEMPEDWAELNGRVGIVYGPPTMKTVEYVDRNVFEGLSNVVAALGIQHERKWNAGRGKLGWASREEGGQIVTQFATELSVMAHEIGHKLDTKYDLWDKLVAGAEGIGKRGEVTKTASAEKRATIQNELRTLADLSWEGSEASPAYKKQVRKKEEKMAHLLEAYIHAKDRFEEVAPTVFKDFDAFIKSTPEISELADIRQGLSLKALTGEKYLGGFPILGHMIAKKPVAEILNNYMSSSLYNNKLFGDAYKWTMSAANVLNMSQLSVGSFFHAGFTSGEVTVIANSHVIQDLYGVIKGNRTIGDLGTSLSHVPMAIIKTPMDGSRILKEWQNPTVNVPTNVPVSQLTNPVAIIAKAAVLAGGGWRLEQGLKTEQTGKMLQDWYGKHKLRAAMRSPIAFIELSAKPIMEWLVPKQKAGVFGYKVQRLIEMNPNKTLQELVPELRAAWNFVDASMGMVRYDRIFLDNQNKNIVQATVRAPGWSGGTIAQIAGGLKDFSKFLAEWTKTGKMPDKLPDRAAYTMSLLITAAAINGALTYAFTGDLDTSPTSTDWWAFRTGENDEQGRPIRYLLPTYAKDLFAYWRHPTKTLLAKAHPMIGVVSDMIRNTDYYGVEIRHKGDSIIAQGGELGMFTVKQFEPFWMRGLEKSAVAAGEDDTLGGMASTIAKNPLKALAPEIGVMPASAEYLNTPAQNTMRDILQARTPKSEKTQAQADIYNLKRQLRGRLQQTGDTEEIHQAVLDGKITSKEARDIIKSKNVPPLVREFKQLEPEEAITVYELGNEVERKELKPLLNKKMRTALKNKTPDARKRILALYNKMMESLGETT